MQLYIKNQNIYQLFCLNQIFPNQITLRINKRLRSDEDKERLARIKKDTFHLKKRPIDTLKKHGIKVINAMKSVRTTHKFVYSISSVTTLINT